MDFEGCLKSTSISILVNGGPTTEFIPQRGLRQGDPLALFLFNIVAGLMREAQQKNLFEGFKVGKNNMDICVLYSMQMTQFSLEQQHGKC